MGYESCGRRAQQGRTVAAVAEMRDGRGAWITVVVGLLVIALVATIAQSDDDDPSAAFSDPSLLIGRDWEFKTLVVDGAPVDLAGNMVVLRFNARRHASIAGACNDSSGRAKFVEDTIRFVAMFSTLAFCGLEPETRDIDHAIATLIDGPVHWSLEGDVLTLRSKHGLASLGPPPNIFPEHPTSFVVLASSDAQNGPQFQFGYVRRGRALLLAFREGPGVLWGDWELGTNANLIGGGIVSPFAMGWVPRKTETAEIVRDSGKTIKLTLYPLPWGTKAFGQPIPDGITGQNATIVAFDADGKEIARR